MIHRPNKVHPKIVVFLGSGASAFAGYRTFETFPSLISDETIRIQEELPPLHSTTLPLLEEIRQTLLIAGKHTTHDNYLWALSDYKTLWHTLRLDGVLRTRFLKSTNLWGEFAYFAQITYDATKDITLITLKHYSANRVRMAKQQNEAVYDAMKRVYSLYMQLASINNPDVPFLPVFTTNYDMLIEDMFIEFGRSNPLLFPLTNGISGNVTEGVHWCKTQFPQTYLDLRGLYLYRIHGCVCWFYHNIGDENAYFHRLDCMGQNSDKLCAMYPGQEAYPGANPHGFGYREFHRMLLDCDCILFIGFSFRDDDVMQLTLSTNAQRRVPLKIIVLDPALRDTDALASLEASSKRTPHPARTPDPKEIVSIDARFGYSDFDTKLMDIINQIK